MTAELAAAGGLGFVLGVVTGMPISVLNVAVVDAAVAGRLRFAIGIGVGGAIADTVHSGLAFAGVGRLIAEHDDWLRATAVIAALMIISYAALTWRGRDAKPRARAHGIVTGVLLTLPNPVALGAWVAVAAAVWPTIPLAGAVVLAIACGLGSAAWFALLARYFAKHRDAPALRFVPKIALALLVALAVAGAVRAFF